MRAGAAGHGDRLGGGRGRVAEAERSAERTRPRRGGRETGGKTWPEHFDLVLAADVLYERRNVEPLVERLLQLAPIALLALAGRPYEETFLREWPGQAESVAERVLRLTPPPG